MEQHAGTDMADGLQQAWRLLLRCARIARDARGDSLQPLAFGLDGDAVAPLAADDPGAMVVLDAGGAWRRCGALSGAAADLLDLYLPLCEAARPVVVGHLGQSLDGYVATSSGDSAFVNDPCNIVHLHRLRALCDAVVVGGATVRDDDPRLTVRHVAGPNPTRVIIDPRLELAPSSQVFTDGAAPTLVACTREALARRPEHPARAGAIVIAADEDGRPDLEELLGGLRRRGCRRVFVEGGGVTVSRFLQADLLDRLQVAVAPFFIGRGRRGISLPGARVLADCVRPRHRVFRMGADVLFDLDLRAAPAGVPAAGSPGPVVRVG